MCSNVEVTGKNAITSIIAPHSEVQVQFLVWKNCVLFYLYHINFQALSIIVWLKLMFVVCLVVSHTHIDQSWPPSRYSLRIGPTSYRLNFVKIGVPFKRYTLPIFLAPPSGQPSLNSAHPFPVSWQAMISNLVSIAFSLTEISNNLHFYS